MFDYTLSTEPDISKFNKYNNILNSIPGIKSKRILKDVDGSMIKLLHLDGKKIKLVLDEYIGATYIESEIDLKKMINLEV